jgi:hypothetical protein
LTHCAPPKNLVATIFLKKRYAWNIVPLSIRRVAAGAENPVTLGNIREEKAGILFVFQGFMGISSFARL